METLLQDLRFALRMWRKSPSFAIATVLTLAVAIGANTVAFATFDALVLRPLKVPHAESLYEVGRVKQENESYPGYLDLRLSAVMFAQEGLDTGDGASRVWGYKTSGNYFDVLGIQPYLGRFFKASDENGPDSAPYIVLTYAYWHTHFHDDRGVLGRSVRLNKRPVTVVGVAPPGFSGTVVGFSAASLSRS
jgi:MacB-like periplasmic core domain